jgi:quinoprotein glucose dehydrogenase
MPPAPRFVAKPRVTGAVIVLLGVGLAAGGAWLAALGGSWYYILTGAALIATGALLFYGRASALALFAVVLLGTLIWAIWEAGLAFWGMAPRGDVLVPIGIWLLLPWPTRGLGPHVRGPRLALLAVVVIAFAAFGAASLRSPDDIDGTVDFATAAPQAAQTADLASQPDSEWQAYGRGWFGDRYAPLAQITPQNVKQLRVAWRFHTGDMAGPNDPKETTMEVTPIKVNHTVYLCSPHQIVFALDAASGQLKWKFDPHVHDTKSFQHLTCRGVSYHETRPGAVAADGTPAPPDCPRRIFLGTNTAQMFALNADNGQPCEGFGTHGEIDLNAGMPVTTAGFYEITSPPLVTDRVLIVGGAVIDNYSMHVPSGVIRGFDIYSGKLLWAFDAGNEDVNQMPSATHVYSAGSPNSWIVSAADEKLGLAYVPLGSSAADIWGGLRTPQQERYDSAIVALDIATGKLRWSFQNVHHDLWDMDMSSQPSLVDVQTAQGVVPALYAPAKTGNIFMLDRRTGQPIVPAPETPVPQNPAPGDRLSPTQPFSQLSFRPREKLTGAQMWGATMFDQLACRILFHRLRYEGPFTPPSTQGTLVFPGDLGMFEWGGLAVDPVRQIIIANPMSIPFVSQLIPRGQDNPPAPDGAHPSGTELGVQPMYGTPYGAKLNPFFSPVGLPCLQPPWGTMAAIDIRTNKVIWRHPVGTIRDSAPVPVPLKIGVPMLGGPITTAGGVAFLTSTLDYYIRAFDVRTGDMLWQSRLPAGGQSTPMTYMEDGRQFVVTADGGHGSFGTKLGDTVMAYALPHP